MNLILRSHLVIPYAYLLSRSSDPRIEYVDFIEARADEIRNLRIQFAGLDAAEIRSRSDAYSEVYKDERNRLDEMIAGEGRFRPQLWVVLSSFITTPIFLQILVSIIGWASQAVTQSPTPIMPEISHTIPTQMEP
jgi:hypothetical protein